MDEELAQKAISHALSSNWNEAIKINLLILEEDKEDVDALNRLARAYFEKGNIAKAKKTSLEVLKINSDNNIAKNSLDRYKQGKQKNKIQNEVNRGVTEFIEEPGRTKLTTLINLGSEKIYSTLNTGDEVLLTPHSHKVSITTLEGEYIGKLTDDLSARLRRLVKVGNKYKILVKSSSKKCVKVFIKEVKRGKDFISTQSFPLEMSESMGEFDS